MSTVLLAAAFSCRLLQLGAASECPGTAGACATHADEAGGAVGLLQQTSARASPRRSGGGSPPGQAVNWSAVCGKLPYLCQAPFNCDSNPVTPEELAHWQNVRLVTDDGHSNPRYWCLSVPDDLDAVNDTTFANVANIPKTCVQDRDFSTFSQVLAANSPPEVDDIIAAYCFQEGFCAMTHAPGDITVEETEAICDAKYGKNWTSFKLKSEIADFSDPNMPPDPRSLAASALTGQWQCANGAYHCDIIDCRDRLCKVKKYVEKYGHYLQ